MKRIWILARREFRSYFDHPTAYILVVAFLGLALFLTFRSLFTIGTASMRSMFSLLPWLLAVFVPAMTMRSLAEERRSGTLEWLLAHPVSELDVLIGKFVGDWLFVMAAVAGTVPAALGVWLLSDADGGIIVAQYVGAALLAAQFVAIGLFASSATRNQITSFVLGMIICFTLILVGLPVVTMGLAPVLAEAVLRLSVLEQYDGIARGVIDLRDALYFVSTGAVFLAVAYALLARERLSAARGAIRRLRLGITAAVVAVVALNLLGARIGGRIDLTADRLYTLSSGTKQVLRNLDDVVTVKLVVSRELPPEVAVTLRDVRDLLADYRRASDGRFRVMELNPDRDDDAAREAAELGIEPIDFNIMRRDEFQIRRGWLGLAILYAGRSEVIPFIDRTDDLEYRLTSMMANLATEDRPTVAFVTGFGTETMFQFSGFRSILAEYYNVTTLDLEALAAAIFETPAGVDVDVSIDPDEYDVLVIASPTDQMPPEVMELVLWYLDAGGAALVMVEGVGLTPESPVTFPVESPVETLLGFYGLEVPGGVVYDLASHRVVQTMSPQGAPIMAPYPFYPVVLPAADDVLTRGLNSMSMAWPTALRLTDPARARPLWTTTRAAGLQEPGGLIAAGVDLGLAATGPQVVAAAVETDRIPVPEGEEGDFYPAGRLIVVGDTDFLTDRLIRGNQQNLIFALNAVDWLAQDESLIAIRSKNRMPPPLVFESEFQQAALKWGNLVGVPLLFVFWGAVRILSRRRLSRRRWEEEFAE